MRSYEILERALALIERPENWCQATAEDAGGRRCAVGAIHTAIGGCADPRAAMVVVDNNQALRDNLGAAASALDEAAIKRGYYKDKHYLPQHRSAIAVLNDCTDHTTVVAAFKEAIRNEKQRLGVGLDIPVPEPTQCQTISA